MQDDSSFRQMRPIEVALADLRAKFADGPTEQLGRMIQQLEAEISTRKDRSAELRSLNTEIANGARTG